MILLGWVARLLIAGVWAVAMLSVACVAGPLLDHLLDNPAHPTTPLALICYAFGLHIVIRQGLFKDD